MSGRPGAISFKKVHRAIDGVERDEHMRASERLLSPAPGSARGLSRALSQSGKVQLVRLLGDFCGWNISRSFTGTVNMVQLQAIFESTASGSMGPWNPEQKIITIAIR